MPTSKDVEYGVSRAEEVYELAYGQKYYDRDALEVFQEGTKENPVMILSNEHERYVGVSGQVCVHCLFAFAGFVGNGCV